MQAENKITKFDVGAAQFRQTPVLNLSAGSVDSSRFHVDACYPTGDLLDFAGQEFQIPDLRFQIPDSRSQIPDSRFQIPDSRSQIRDSRSQIPDFRFQIQDSRFQIQDSRSQIPDFKSQIIWNLKSGI